MTVIGCREDAKKRGGSMSYDVGAKRIVRSYTRTFFVATSDPNDSAPTVICASGLPPIGTVYETENELDIGCFLMSIDPEQEPDDPTHWRVTLGYSSQVPVQQVGSNDGGNKSQDKLPGNPLDKPTLFEFGRATGPPRASSSAITSGSWCRRLPAIRAPGRITSDPLSRPPASRFRTRWRK